MSVRTTSPLSNYRIARLALVGLAIGLLALPRPVAAQEDHSELTAASYRRNCLLCHHSAAPEGVAPEILIGLTPVEGLKPRDAMPGVACQRRCEACKLPAADPLPR